jgi:DNA-binding NtrC family response regulator
MSKALIVDDEDLILQVASDLLTHLGFEVETVTSLEAAIDRFQGGRFHLLLTDYTFPVGKAESLIDFVKEHSPLTRIVLMSGSMTVPELGVPFLKKPFTFDQLKQVVRQQSSVEQRSS